MEARGVVEDAGGFGGLGQEVRAGFAEPRVVRGEIPGGQADSLVSRFGG